MPGGVQRKLDVTNGNGFTVREGLQVNVLPQALPKNVLAPMGCEVSIRPRPGMVSVGIRYNRPRHRIPRINVKITGRTVNTVLVRLEKRFGHTA